MSIKLNLGAGDVPLDGYINVDRKTGGEVYPVRLPDTGTYGHDVLSSRTPAGKTWKLRDGTVDEIRASHVLEHFGHRLTLDVMKEWVRVLRPGGMLKIAVPDFDRIISYYQTGSDPLAESYLMGGHVDDNDHHGAIFNEQKLRELMRLAGLTGIRPWKSEIGDCASLPVSLNLMGVKRPPVTELAGISAVMSMPRYAFTQPLISLMEMTAKLKIPTRIRQGVFWHSTLEQAIEMTLADDKGCRYILAIDFDTVFHPQHVAELYQLMEANPDVAVVFPVQVGRDRDTVLMTARGEDGKLRQDVAREEVEAELMTVATGHFGLTLIRTEVFRKLAKPWFNAIPAPDGGWGDGRIDSDIYFWKKMEEAGMRVCQANAVRIGHWQEVVTWADQNLAPIHQYAGDYRKDGPPGGI